MRNIKAHWAADGDIPWHRICYIRCNWVSGHVNLFAYEPVDNTGYKIFLSDHFGIRAVIKRSEDSQTLNTSLK
ncbi:MAG: hypothetical protein WBA39_27035 [Rivularia sp. (in: cyanobacteria)]